MSSSARCDRCMQQTRVVHGRPTHWGCLRPAKGHVCSASSQLTTPFKIGGYTRIVICNLPVYIRSRYPYILVRIGISLATAIESSPTRAARAQLAPRRQPAHMPSTRELEHRDATCGSGASQAARTRSPVRTLLHELSLHGRCVHLGSHRHHYRARHHSRDGIVSVCSSNSHRHLAYLRAQSIRIHRRVLELSIP